MEEPGAPDLPTLFLRYRTELAKYSSARGMQFLLDNVGQRIYHDKPFFFSCLHFQMTYDKLDVLLDFYGKGILRSITEIADSAPYLVLHTFMLENSASMDSDVIVSMIEKGAPTLELSKCLRIAGESPNFSKTMYFTKICAFAIAFARLGICDFLNHGMTGHAADIADFVWVATRASIIVTIIDEVSESWSMDLIDLVCRYIWPPV